MGSTSSDRVNISARTQKLEVDHNLPLRFYIRMSDFILRQADIYREEKDILYLYITLIRFASLVYETIPDHRDYITCNVSARTSWKKVKKKLWKSLDELEELNPEVKQLISELNRRNGYQNNQHEYKIHKRRSKSDKKKVESAETCSSSTGGDNGNKKLKKETRIQVLLEEAHDWKLPSPFTLIPQATAPPVEEDVELAKAIDASIQSALQEMTPVYDPIQIHETNTSTSSSIAIHDAMEYSGFSEHETSPGGYSGLDSQSHFISTIQSSSTSSDSMPSYPTPSAPPVSDDCLDDHFQDCLDDYFQDCLDDHFQDCPDDPFLCRSTESTPVKKDEQFSSCVICMDAAIEGAFIPCGHMAGCMACMNDIKDKNLDCPLCRAKVDQVLKLYAV